jgi:UDP-glucuronate decarboxylase
MTRVLVTGGAGFIGSHLCERFLTEGLEVICLDNFSTGKLENIEHLLKNTRFKLINCDLVDPVNISTDFICNMACPASPIHYQKDPIATIKTSTIGTLNMLELVKQNHGIILQASTSEVYGDPHEHPQSEKYWGHVNPIGVRSCYDEGKRLAEALCFAYRRQFNLNIKIVRIFNTFGIRMNPDDGRVIPNFIHQALTDQDITIYGDGKQTRSFCYISDLVDGIVKMIDSAAEVTGPINLGNPVEISILELAEIILKLTKSHSKIIFHTLPQDDPKLRKPDIHMAKSILGWEPKVKFEDGLKEMIAYVKRNS